MQSAFPTAPSPLCGFPPHSTSAQRSLMLASPTKPKSQFELTNADSFLHASTKWDLLSVTPALKCVFISFKACKLIYAYSKRSVMIYFYQKNLSSSPFVVPFLFTLPSFPSITGVDPNNLLLPNGLSSLPCCIHLQSPSSSWRENL